MGDHQSAVVYSGGEWVAVRRQVPGGTMSHVTIVRLPLPILISIQCQLKLRHSVTSLAQTLDYIEVAQRRHPADWTLDHLTLKLIKRKVLARLSVF